MKKIDILVLKAFWGPLITTFAVAEFIFILRFLLLYFDDIAGRDVALTDYANLIGFVALMTVPTTMPLAILLASLMCFGNLGEYSELTAIKSAGISIIRCLLPVGVVALFITVGLRFYNDHVQPTATLKAYSLLYDIKTTKAALSFKEGIFNNDLTGYSIKVSKKFPDGRTLKNVLIYNHTQRNGNRRVTGADSARMFTIHGGQYLIFELFNGTDFTEDPDQTSPNNNQTDFTRNTFKKSKIVINMKDFAMSRTDEEQFKGHAIMQTSSQLESLSDSLKKAYNERERSAVATARRQDLFQFSPLSDSIARKLKGSWVDIAIKKELPIYRRTELTAAALSAARSRTSAFENDIYVLDDAKKLLNKNQLEWHHKYTSSVACFVMFLIGGPLGSIIRKGGFGLPVLVAIVFFILMYVLTIQGDKYAREGTMWVLPAAWMSNMVLLGCGIFFMRKAILEANLFGGDGYTRFIKQANVVWEKSQDFFNRGKFYFSKK